jgi:RecB family exonuclease
VITPRATRLVRADNLPSLHRAVFALAIRGDLAAVRRRAIIVPTRAAALHLRQTLEALWFERGDPAREAALALPDLLTRGDWYQRMHERANIEEPRLSPLEREVLLAAAARDAVDEGAVPPFRLRPGLVAEMLAFYDELCGRPCTLEAFERLTVEELEPRAETDRGADRLLRQTRFLVAAFHAFERRVTASGRLDEQALRARLLDPATPPAFTHLVVTVGDRAAEPSGGLAPVDVDLLMRLPHVDTIHLVATRGQLDAGLGERLHALIPELEEVDAEALAAAPRLAVPSDADGRLHFVARDREEELRATARRIKLGERGRAARSLGRLAVVFKRPLPYVYLARTVFQSARVEYQAADALPLASEPMAAVIDLLFAAVESRFARSAVVALLRSPHICAPVDGAEPEPSDVGAFDRGLVEKGYLGRADALARLAGEWQGEGATAARAACALVTSLLPLDARQRVSAHASALLAFLREHERVDVSGEADDVRSRHLRARGAVIAALEGLRLASLDLDDPVVTTAEAAATVRRWLEAETFTPRRGASGVQLIDAQAARYASFDEAWLTGLAEGEWPEPTARNIFYPACLLSQLGWPADSARVAASRAAFLDLLRLPAGRVTVSTFTLEDDSIVNPSPLLEDLAGAGLETEVEVWPRAPVFADEALTLVPAAVDAVEGSRRRWLETRIGRTPGTDPRFHGFAGAREPAVPASPRHGDEAAGTYSVTSIDRYLQCPFKYFAATVLSLPEESADQASRTPRARGQFVHDVFRAFFESWQADGGCEISVEVLDRARRHFAEAAERKLAALPAGEAVVERTRLLGSAGTAGLGEIVLAAEAARPVPVRERLLEYGLDGVFTIDANGASRRVRLRGQVDRVDLLADGRFRVIDYKSGKAPEPAQTIQLPIYVVCLEQQLRRVRGGRWQVAEASYLAFGERKPLRIVVAEGEAGERALGDGQARLLEAIDRIERGEFPPRPAAPRLCGQCPYANVCRKDYVDGE